MIALISLEGSSGVQLPESVHDPVPLVTQELSASALEAVRFSKPTTPAVRMMVLIKGAGDIPGERTVAFSVRSTPGASMQSGRKRGRIFIEGG